MTIKEGVEAAKAARAGKSLAGKPLAENKTPEKKALCGGSLEDHMNNANVVAKTPPKALSPSPKTVVRDSSQGSKKAAKISGGSLNLDGNIVSKDETSKQVPHYLRPSTSSCHDACKYGVKSNPKSSDASPKPHRHPQILRKMAQPELKPAASRTPMGSRSIANATSPIGSSSSSRIAPEKRVRVNKAESQPKLVKHFPLNSRNADSKSKLENKSKAASTSQTKLNRSLKPSVHGHGNAKAATPLLHKKMSFKVKVTSTRKAEKKNEVKSHSLRSVSSSVSRNAHPKRPVGAGTFKVCRGDRSEGRDSQVCKHSQSAAESNCEEHDPAFQQQVSNGGDLSVKLTRYDGNLAAGFPVHKDTECDECGDEEEDFEPYVENIVTQNADNPDLDSPYSDEYTEYSESPGSGSYNEEIEPGNVRKQNQVIHAQEGNYGLQKRRFRRGRSIRHSGDSNPQPENVILKHQDVQGRKASEEWMLNHVIEAAVNKLSATRKSKVKTLVGAFETVISLTESEAHDLKQVDAEDLAQAGSLQSCT